MGKQTAVEFLVEQLNIKYGNNDFIITFENLIKEAKEMEKEQIIDFVIWFDNTIRKPKEIKIEVEEYYHEIFKK
jgi:hypothetical protein